jgi:hypothetical protein
MWGNRRGGWNEPFFGGGYGSGGWGSSSYDPFYQDPFFSDFGLLADVLAPALSEVSVPTQRYGRDRTGRVDRDIRNAERQLSGRKNEPDQANFFRTSTTTLGEDGIRRTRETIKYRNDEGNELVKESKRMGDQIHIVTRRIINGKEEIEDNLYPDEAKRFDEMFEQVKRTPRIEDLREQMQNLQNQLLQLEQGSQSGQQQQAQLGQGQQQGVSSQVSGYPGQQQGEGVSSQVSGFGQQQQVQQQQGQQQQKQ